MTTPKTTSTPAKTEDKKPDEKDNPNVYVGKDEDGNFFYAAAGSKAAKNAARAAEAAAAESKAKKK